MAHPSRTHPAPTRPRRKRRQLDWELITCGFQGHVLVGRDAGRGPPAGRTCSSRTTAIVRWHRCLRCDSWVALPLPERSRAAASARPRRDRRAAAGQGPARPDRAAADRDRPRRSLRRAGPARGRRAAVRRPPRHAARRLLPDPHRAPGRRRPAARCRPPGHVGILRDLDRLFSLRSGTLHEVGAALLGYGLLEGVEAVGLWYAKRWAEYLTFIATTLLLPLEIYEIIHAGHRC